MAWTVPALSDDDVRLLGAGRVVVRDGALARDEALALRGALDERLRQGRMVPLGTGADRHLDPEVRGDLVEWLEPGTDDPVLRLLWGWLDALREEINRTAWLGLRRQEVQLACYPGDGARYVRHTDALRGTSARRVTAIVYLNPDWTPAHGGALRAFVDGSPHTIEPYLGRLVLFRSEVVPHEVEPTNAPRYAVSGWFRAD